jgi:hypothetical protein
MFSWQLVVWLTDSAHHSALFPVIGVQYIAVRRVISERYAALCAFCFGSDGLAHRSVIGLDSSAVSLVIGSLHHRAGECGQY